MRGGAASQQAESTGTPLSKFLPTPLLRESGREDQSREAKEGGREGAKEMRVGERVHG